MCLKPLLSAPCERSRDASHLFDHQLFLKHCPVAEWPFFSYFFDTQIFNAFIEQRSFAHARSTALAFFDECTEKVHPSVCLSVCLSVKMVTSIEQSCFSTYMSNEYHFPSRCYQTPLLNYWMLEQMSPGEFRGQSPKCKRPLCTFSPHSRSDLPTVVAVPPNNSNLPKGKTYRYFTCDCDTMGHTDTDE